MNQTMQAAVMKHPGAPEVLDIQAVPLPWPGEANHVLVRLKAAGVNPADAYFRSSGPYVGDGKGCILGHDGAGVVEDVGPSVTRIKAGDEVCFCYGEINVHVSEVFPLGQAAEAHHLLEAGSMTGKIVLEMNV